MVATRTQTAGGRINDILRVAKPTGVVLNGARTRVATASNSKAEVAGKRKTEPGRSPCEVKREVEEVTVRAPKRVRKVKTEPVVDSRIHPIPPPLHDDILTDALRHLTSVDPRFEALSRRFVCRPWTAGGLSERPNHFRSLALGIMSQQVSGAAARSISRKFVNLFRHADLHAAHVDVDIDPEVEDGPAVKTETQIQIKTETQIPIKTETDTDTSIADPSSAPAQDREELQNFPTPAQVASADVLYLKSAGLSLRKAEYVQGLALAFVENHLDDAFFASATDDEIVDRLTSLRGLGPWSAEMFLMFSLKRLDVLSYGDIGIQRGMSYWLGKDARDKSSHVVKGGKFKFVSQTEMDELSDTWRPFRSIGCWYMWRVDSVTS